jgi:hypothetical protein
MAVWHRGLYGYSEGVKGRFRIEATTTAGEFLIRNAAANTAGEVEKPLKQTLTASPATGNPAKKGQSGSSWTPLPCGRSA